MKSKKGHHARKCPIFVLCGIVCGGGSALPGRKNSNVFCYLQNVCNVLSLNVLGRKNSNVFCYLQNADPAKLQEYYSNWPVGSVVKRTLSEREVRASIPESVKSARAVGDVSWKLRCPDVQPWRCVPPLVTRFDEIRRVGLPV